MSKGLKIMFYYTFVLVCVAVIVALAIPSSTYPDEVETAEGKKEKLDAEKKKQLKMAVVMAITMLGCIALLIANYFYKTSLRWTRQDALLSNYR